MAVNRKIRGIRDSIPPGYIVGRLSPGNGPPELINYGGVRQIAGAAGVGGSVTSVALSAPAMFTVTGSPVTSSGTLSLALANQSANLVFAGPTSGGAAAPTFRALVTADYPDASVTLAKIQNASGNSKLLGAGAADSGAAYSEITLGSGLTMTGTTLSASGSGGNQGWTIDNPIYDFNNISTNSIGAATIGYGFTPTETYPLYGVLVGMKPVASAAYKLSLVTINGSNVIQSVVATQTWTAPGSVSSKTGMYRVMFSASQSLVSGTHYAILFTRTDATTTTAITVDISSPSSPGYFKTLPNIHDQTQLYDTSLSPAVSDTCTTGSGATASIALIGLLT